MFFLVGTSATTFSQILALFVVVPLIFLSMNSINRHVGTRDKREVAHSGSITIFVSLPPAPTGRPVVMPTCILSGLAVNRNIFIPSVEVRIEI